MIDEISYRVAERSLTVVVDHDTGRLVWAREGRDKATVKRFFDLLGGERTAKIEAVTSDLAPEITRHVAQSCPNATRCTDSLHVVALATDALDVVRRELSNDRRRGGDKQGARFLKGARSAVWKNPENRTDRQQTKLAQLQKTNKHLHRSYLLQEALRAVCHAETADNAMVLLDGSLAWARRCRIQSFTKLAKTIKAHRARIEATLRLGLTDARIEAVNTTLRVLVRRAYAFHSAAAMIALAILVCGGLRPALPGRARAALPGRTAMLRQLDGAALHIVATERPFAHICDRSPGKTMLAVGLALRAIDAGYRVYCTTAADLITRTASRRRTCRVGHAGRLSRPACRLGRPQEYYDFVEFRKNCDNFVMKAP